MPGNRGKTHQGRARGIRLKLQNRAVCTGLSRPEVICLSKIHGGKGVKSVFEALYDGDIDERNKKRNLPKDNPEFAAYDKLDATLYNPED